MHPADTATPTASNLNFPAGTTVPNQVGVGLPDDGRIVLRNGAAHPIHLVADVAGWYAAADTGTAPPAAITVSGDPSVGGTVTITGEGWVHPDGGGSTVAMKIDRGNVRLPDGSSDVWLTLTAASDGTFSAEFTFPDGTTGPGGSTPALAGGEHTLFFLSGSLSPGDAVRSVSATVDLS